MAELRSQDKRDKLRLLYAQCKPQAKTLQELLMEALQVCDDAISASGSAPGTFLSSTSENGGSVSFSMLAQYSPIVAKRLIGEMLDAYDKAAADIGDGATDAQIYAWLMTYFQPIRKFRSDFTGGRYGIGYHLGNS